LAPTLMHLELRLAYRWMDEGENAFAPVLKQLVNLKNLFLFRVDDGPATSFKALESLTKLEHVYFVGCNALRLPRPPKPAPQIWTIDLSAHRHLKSLIFADASLCHESEWGKGGFQALVAPPQLTEFGCLGYRGKESYASKALETHLQSSDVAVLKPDFPDGDEEGLKQFWLELEQRAPWAQAKPLT